MGTPVNQRMNWGEAKRKNVRGCMMLVTIEVEIHVEPNPELWAAAADSYVPTLKAPEPDEEWICGEIAMRRLGKVRGVIDQMLIEVSRD